MKKQNARLLQEENKHIESICLLEETVKLLEEREHTSKVEKISDPVKTEIIRCDECEYPAECIVDLVEHMHEFHPLGNSQPGIDCHYCGENFPIKKDLM